MIFIAVVFSFALVLITLKHPSIGLGLAAAADLMILEGIPIGGTSVAPESFYFLFILMVPLLGLLVRSDDRELPFTDVWPLLVFFGIFLGACIVSSVLGGGLARAQSVLIRLPLWVLFGVAPVWICRRPNDLQRMTTVVIWGTAILFLVALVNGLPSPEDQGGVLRSGYLNPLGHAFALAGVMCFATQGNAVRHLLRKALMVMFLLGVIWTGSRGAFLAGAIGMGTVAWILSPSHMKSVGKLSALSGALLLLFAFASGFIGDLWSNFLANDASSNLYRYQIMTLAGRLFASSPVIGVGIGSMEATGIFHSQGLRTIAVRIIANDNEYARVVAELGSAGVLILLGWVRYTGIRYANAVRAVRGLEPGRLSVLALGAGVGTYLMALGLFESILFSPTGWFYIGVSWACVRVARK